MSCLERLLDKIRYNPVTDCLWFVGDLISRGPDSEAVLRFVKSLKGRATVVLGNHDLHFLALSAGLHQNKTAYRLDRLLHAPDLDELTDFVRHLPLAHFDSGLNTAMAHAGLYPGWSLHQGLLLAHEVEKILRSDQWLDLLAHMYGNTPARWSDQLTGWARLRFITNAFTRMRFCMPDLSLELEFKGLPAAAPAPLKPWFDLNGQSLGNTRLIFGHWSDLGIYNQRTLYGIDGGCVWGRQLAAMHLQSENGNIVTVSCSR